MPSFGFDTTRFSLWEWCRLRGAGHSRLEVFIDMPHGRGHGINFVFPQFANCMPVARDREDPEKKKQHPRQKKDQGCRHSD